MRWWARSIGAASLLAGCSTALAVDTAPELPIRITYSPWFKSCQVPGDASLSPMCFTGKEGRDASGQVLISVMLIEADSDPKPILRATVPLGVQLLYGTRLIVGNDPPQLSPYVSCFANGCTSDYQAAPEMIASLRKRQQLFVQAIGADGKPITWELSLSDFAVTHDGPALASADFERQQKEAERTARQPVHDDTLAPHYRPQWR